MSASPRQRSTTRKLATALQPVETVDIVWGVVTAVNTGPPKTVSVKLLSSATPVKARYAKEYTPTVGDNVMCTYRNRDLFALTTPA
jgi:hypothetical protein